MTFTVGVDLYIVRRPVARQRRLASRLSDNYQIGTPSKIHCLLLTYDSARAVATLLDLSHAVNG